MLKLNVYLNFMGKTEEAFNFYKSVFGGELLGLQRISQVPLQPNQPAFSSEDLNKIMHVELNIGNDVLMGTDMLESMGHKLVVGNNVNLSLHPETKEEAERLFKLLSEGGEVEMPLEMMFWGAWYAGFSDKYGVKWMINFQPSKN